MRGAAVVPAIGRPAVQSLFNRMYEMGLTPLPMPNSTGSDDGLLWHQGFPDYIDTVAVWAETYAVALRVPAQRNWITPFASSPVIYRCIGSLHEAVSGLSELPPYKTGLGARHRQC